MFGGIGRVGNDRHRPRALLARIGDPVVDQSSREASMTVIGVSEDIFQLTNALRAFPGVQVGDWSPIHPCAPVLDGWLLDAP